MITWHVARETVACAWSADLFVPVHHPYICKVLLSIDRSSGDGIDHLKVAFSFFTMGVRSLIRANDLAFRFQLLSQMSLLDAMVYG